MSKVVLHSERCDPPDPHKLAKVLVKIRDRDHMLEVYVAGEDGGHPNTVQQTAVRMVHLGQESAPLLI
ncbi:hypothetical protein BBK82_07240 [Lentzea guizhouensis]|uniref:Uncharacterized protein n=1 Tax=Lentzea guizhouensis TaxID=1586287 RepID=A0A1B2HDY0_9PSEU|nr:hypothetical protein BBK82_07240 [Lentzea guizhouensis]